MKPPQIYLASSSPRRSMLLKELGWEFSVLKISFDEATPTNTLSTDVATYLAQEKNRIARTSQRQGLIITADTVVIYEGKILGKPHSTEEAVQMLQLLSGSSHVVNTAVCVSHQDKIFTFDTTTEVTFIHFSQQLIHKYVTHYEPFDKAGSYGVQEWLGVIGVSKIKGSYTGIMGLPLAQLVEVLANKFSIKMFC